MDFETNAQEDSNELWIIESTKDEEKIIKQPKK